MFFQRRSRRQAQAEWAAMLDPALLELSTSTRDARSAARRVRSRIQELSPGHDLELALEAVRWAAVAQGAPRIDDLLTRRLDEAVDAEEAALEHDDTQPEATDRQLTQIEGQLDADERAIYATATDDERAAIVAGELEGILTLLERKIATVDEARTAVLSVRERWVR
ncbi:MAG: hypothetical protein ABWY56_16610 [Propionibacteriaceae bacterium]